MDHFLGWMDSKGKSESEIRLINPLVLAYIGDAVYEVYIREYILLEYTGNVNKLHRMATRFVKASGQAKIVHAIEEELTTQEWSMVKKGRNQKSNSVPKNADVTEYKYATGFETLIGYLYLMRKNDRIKEIIKKGIEIIQQDI